MMWPWFNWGYGGFGGLNWIMPVLMIVFWGLIIWGIIALVRWGRHSTYHSADAMEILKRRYASGEINKEEFEEKKRTLA